MIRMDSYRLGIHHITHYCSVLPSRETIERMTARELIEICDIPPSMVYRKLDLLSTASIVRERLEIHPEGGSGHVVPTRLQRRDHLDGR